MKNEYLPRVVSLSCLSFLSHQVARDWPGSVSSTPANMPKFLKHCKEQAHIKDLKWNGALSDFMHKTPVSSWLGKLGSPTELQMLDHASGGTCIWWKVMLAYTSRAKLGEKDFESHDIASPPIGAWKVNFPPLYEIMTDLSTDQLTD